jgi:hypothetical protein
MPNDNNKQSGGKPHRRQLKAHGGAPFRGRPQGYANARQKGQPCHAERSTVILSEAKDLRSEASLPIEPDPSLRSG